MIRNVVVLIWCLLLLESLFQVRFSAFEFLWQGRSPPDVVSVVLTLYLCSCRHFRASKHEAINAAFDVSRTLERAL